MLKTSTSSSPWVVRNAARSRSPAPMARASADADAYAARGRADGHQHGECEGDRRYGFGADPAEVDRLDETRQRHGEETQNHVPRKAHEVSGQVALGERGVSQLRTVVHPVHVVIVTFRSRFRPCRSIDRPVLPDSYPGRRGPYRMSPLPDQAPSVERSCARTGPRLA